METYSLDLTMVSVPAGCPRVTRPWPSESEGLKGLSQTFQHLFLWKYRS